jgi:hypothetical protein
MRTRNHTVAAALLLGLASAPAQLQAQRFVAVPPPPDQPSAEGFDAERALFFAEPNFTPWRDPEWRSLREALRAGDVAEDTPVLVFETGGRTLTLVSSQMAYHHVAQGEMAGEAWMVTF